MNNLVKEYIENFFYLDIETIPEGEMKTVEELKKEAPKNYKKEETIQKWAEERQEEEYRSRSLHSLKGRLVSVAIAVNKQADSVDTIRVVKYNKDESAMVGELADIIRNIPKHASYGWCGKNIKDFDMLWLMHRFLKYGYEDLIATLPSDGKDGRIVELQDMFAFTAYKKYYSMEEIMTWLGFETKRDGVDGSRVYDLYREGKMDKIYKYNAEDVYDNRQLHNKLRGA
jgi:predicted PolB exonuclease-like 3'-5' exonuclease